MGDNETIKLAECYGCGKTGRMEVMRWYQTLGAYLCEKCRHNYRKVRDLKKIREGTPKELLRVLADDMRTVVRVGKDVPAGYQDDPKVINKKLDVLESQAEKKRKMTDKWIKEFWGRANYYIRKMKELGFSEKQINRILLGWERGMADIKRRGVAKK